MVDHKSLRLILYLRYIAVYGDLTMMGVFWYVTLIQFTLLQSFVVIFEIKNFVNASEEVGLVADAEKTT